MKCLNLFLIFFSCLLSSALWAQTSKQIESDLLKSFSRIGYWDGRLQDTAINANDSLDKANNAFGEKLQYLTESYSSTITFPFALLKKNHLNICNSADGLFRIYSWDTGGDGTMREFENVMQYRDKLVTHSIWVRDTVVGRLDKYVPYYTNIYIFKSANKTYYLGIYEGIYCSTCLGQGLQIFTIENGKLNDDVKIIKTQTGLHSQLYYEYAFDGNKGDDIKYDAAEQTISLPVVIANRRTKNKRIIYKFIGRYFQRVKN